MAFSHDAPPLPGRAVIAQRWSRALFLHWRADAARLAPLLPPGVRPDVFDGSGWIGLVPFVLSKFQFLPAPPVPAPWPVLAALPAGPDLSRAAASVARDGVAAPP